jgi:hypothetical protein
VQCARAASLLMSSFFTYMSSARNPYVGAHVAVHAGGGIHVSHRTYIHASTQTTSLPRAGSASLDSMHSASNIISNMLFTHMYFDACRDYTR